jgi:hypothetical protein
VVVTLAPALSNACAMTTAMRGSSSTIRTEHPLKSGLFMGDTMSAARRIIARGRRPRCEGPRCPELPTSPQMRNKRDDRLRKAGPGSAKAGPVLHDAGLVFGTTTIQTLDCAAARAAPHGVDHDQSARTIRIADHPGLDRQSLSSTPRRAMP